MWFYDNLFFWNSTNYLYATEIEIRNIFKLSPAKSCELDPLPTWLLKECIAELMPTITDIVNMSLRDSLMPVPKISAYSWWNCQATHNRLQIEINYYPDSLLFVSAGFLPRVSSQRLN